MKEIVKTYIVSSANWDIEVDHVDKKSAALSALLMAFGKFGNSLLMSTTVMVNEKKFFLKKDLQNSDFFATFNLLNEIGLTKMSKSFKDFTELLNEIKSTN